MRVCVPGKHGAGSRRGFGHHRAHGRDGGSSDTSLRLSGGADGHLAPAVTERVRPGDERPSQGVSQGGTSGGAVRSSPVRLRDLGTAVLPLTCERRNRTGSLLDPQKPVARGQFVDNDHTGVDTTRLQLHRGQGCLELSARGKGAKALAGQQFPRPQRIVQPARRNHTVRERMPPNSSGQCRMQADTKRNHTVNNGRFHWPHSWCTRELRRE